MADIFRQGQHPETKIFQKLLGAIMLSFVLSALQQFEIGLDRNESLIRVLDHNRGLGMASFNPDEDIGIKDHENARLADDPSCLPLMRGNEHC